MTLNSNSAGLVPTAICRMCEARNLRDLGSLPDMRRFAGVLLDTVLPGGQLLECEDCQSLQRYPLLPLERYSQLYAAGTQDVWTAEAHRPDHERVSAFLMSKAPPTKVLDIGCNTGRFLKLLPAGVEKFGVEPSLAASNRARDAGITILGTDVSSIPADMRFDYITLIDVIEHLPHPGALVDEALRLLAPGGRLVISTGDPHCTAWRARYRNKFWYCSFAEHISFPSRPWLASCAARHDCVVDHVEEFRYGDFGFVRTSAKWLFQFSYRFVPIITYVAGWLMMRERASPFAKSNLFLPCAGVYWDHHLISISSQR